MEAFTITDRGLRRQENQDRLILRELEDGTILAAVADGMGGEAGGGQAAQIAVDILKEFKGDLPETEARLKALFQKASETIRRKVQDSPKLAGMGTTLTAVCLKDGMAYWAHVGDSRLFLFRSGRLIQITEDHTYVNLLIKLGEITPEKARGHPLENLLTHCVGCLPLEVSTGNFGILSGDQLILSSDGLHHEVTEDRMSSILSGKTGLNVKCKELLKAAIEAGGRDNVTIVALLV